LSLKSVRPSVQAFQAAEADAAAGRPAVLFLDELDTLCPTRSAHKQHEARVAAQLLTLMDGAGGRWENPKPLTLTPKP
jgi:SpoVK/Ycf46/Vps4 family AAA+-type ATPase